VGFSIQINELVLNKIYGGNAKDLEQPTNLEKKNTVGELALFDFRVSFRGVAWW
jgi:hypothetical protein